MIGFKEHGEDFKAGGPEFYLARYNRMNRVLLDEFDAALVQLKAAMAEYLNFHTVEW